MRPGLTYAVFCAAVLALFTLAQARGIAAFGWLGGGNGAVSSRTAGGGFTSRGSGGFSGSHK